MWKETAEELIHNIGTGEHGLTEEDKGSRAYQINDWNRKELQEKLCKTIQLRDLDVLPEKLVYPLTIQCEITFLCNLRCPMCYNVSGPSRVNSPREPELSDEEWLEHIEECLRNGAMEVIISGGEPFLRADLVLRILSLCKRYDANTMMITNGTRLTEPIVRAIAAYRTTISWIQVSIDGPDAESHESSRGVGGCWKKALEGAALLAKYGLSLRIASTMHRATFRKMPDLVDLAVALGASVIVLGKVLNTGMAAANGQQDAFSKSDLEEYWALMEQQIKTKSHLIRISPGMESHVQLRLHYIEPTFAVVVRPNGDVKIGCVAPFVVGNLRRQSLKDIWDAKASLAYRLPEVEQYIRDIKTSSDEALVYNRLGIPKGEDSLVIA